MKGLWRKLIGAKNWYCQVTGKVVNYNIQTCKANEKNWPSQVLVRVLTEWRGREWSNRRCRDDLEA